MTQFETTLHWIYVLIMFGSGLLFQILSRNPKGVPSYKYLIHTFVVVWSGLAYSAIALGQGSIEANGMQVYFPRYIDWVITTPLLLLSLALTGKFKIAVEGTLTAALMGTQAIMIITGLVAELSADEAKWFWYLVGCIALVIVLYLMWVPLRKKAQAQGKEIAAVYKKSAAFLTFQWLAYPLVWLIGSMGLGLLNSTITTALFVLLPVVSKAGFGFFNLLSLRGLPEHEKERQPDQLS